MSGVPNVIDLAADALHRLEHAQVGADTTASGKYAAYFYDNRGRQLLRIGGFQTLAQASRAIWVARADAALTAARSPAVRS